MPQLDMPLEKLREYRGINPKPGDHAEYWQRALEEMRSVDPQVELTPAEFQPPFAECFDLTFTGVRGARVYAKYMRPKKDAKACPAVLQFHGYSGASSDWLYLSRWPASGFCTAALDCRGQGGRSEDTGGVKGNTLRGHIIRGLDSDPSGDDLLFRHIFLDTAQLAQIVMGFDEVDEERVGAAGGSQGGALTLACASLEPRIKRAAPVYPFLCDYLRVWEMDQAKGAYEDIGIFLKKFDPTHEHREEWFTRLGYIDVQHLTDRIKGKVLMGTGLMDNICPPSTQFAAYNKITTEKEVVIYPDFGHEGLPGFDERIYQFMLGL